MGIHNEFINELKNDYFYLNHFFNFCSQTSVHINKYLSRIKNDFDVKQAFLGCISLTLAKLFQGTWWSVYLLLIKNSNKHVYYCCQGNIWGL